MTQWKLGALTKGESLIVTVSRLKCKIGADLGHQERTHKLPLPAVAAPNAYRAVCLETVPDSTSTLKIKAKPVTGSKAATPSNQLAHV